MSKKLLFGYALCISTLSAMIFIANGGIRQLDGLAAFFITSLVGLLMFVAAILCFAGARISTGGIRKFLAYSVSAISTFIGVGSAAAVIIVLLGSAKVY